MSNPIKKITKEQHDVLLHILDEYPQILTMILEQWKLDTLKDMPYHKFMTALQRILELRDHYKSLKNSTLHKAS